VIGEIGGYGSLAQLRPAIHEKREGEERERNKNDKYDCHERRHAGSHSDVVQEAVQCVAHVLTLCNARASGLTIKVGELNRLKVLRDSAFGARAEAQTGARRSERAESDSKMRQETRFASRS